MPGNCPHLTAWCPVYQPICDSNDMSRYCVFLKQVTIKELGSMSSIKLYKMVKMPSPMREHFNRCVDYMEESGIKVTILEEEQDTFPKMI